MVDVIPAIIAENYKELEDKIKSIEGLCGWAHIDVMDGKFVAQKTFNQPADLASLQTDLKLEAHLMIEHPWDFIDNWLKAKIKRIIIHYEAISSRFDIKNILDEMIAKCHMAGCEFSIAINPETPFEELGPHILKIDTVFVMGVKPGRAGQLFRENVLVKIKNLREMYPGVKIEVDGGVNLGTAPAILKSGADILVAGSYIWGAEDKKEAINQLKSLKA